MKAPGHTGKVAKVPGEQQVFCTCGWKGTIFKRTAYWDEQRDDEFASHLAAVEQARIDNPLAGFGL